MGLERFHFKNLNTGKNPSRFSDFFHLHCLCTDVFLLFFVVVHPIQKITRSCNLTFKSQESFTSCTTSPHLLSCQLIKLQNGSPEYLAKENKGKISTNFLPTQKDRKMDFEKNQLLSFQQRTACKVFELQKYRRNFLKVPTDPRKYHSRCLFQ